MSEDQKRNDELTPPDCDGDEELVSPPSPTKKRAPRNRGRKLLKWTSIGCGVLLVCMGFGGFAGFEIVEYTSKPKFCITCHFMQPYYDSWKASAHKDVTCTDCHFAPGFRSIVKGKFLGLAQVAKYVTGTQASRPAAEISDKSCLRSGCHETRLLKRFAIRDSSLLKTDEVLDWKALHRAVSATGGAAPVVRMRELLPKKIQTEIGAVQDVAKPQEEDVKGIVDALNAVLKQQDFCSSDEVADLPLSDEAKDLLGQDRDDLPEKDVERLNRLLLEAALPDVIADSHLFKGVPFDHRKHMKTLRRGKRLRCVSCHSQIVQGAHMTVTESTCFLCHFKDFPFNKEQGKCTLCHKIPTKTVTRGDIDFEHGEVKERGIPCEKCHFNITRGKGEVPKERCRVCHNRKGDTDRYGETVFIHNTHVTTHKVECLDCHLTIQHSLETYDAVAKVNCDDCHPNYHMQTRQLYMGTGGRDLDVSVKSAMVTMRAGCKSCHISHEVEGKGGEVVRASSDSCAKCHGEDEKSVVKSWKLDLKSGIAKAKVKLAEAKAKLVEMDRFSDEYKQALAIFESAANNLALVEKGNGVHNIDYSTMLLDSVDDLVAQIKKSGAKKKQ